MIKVLFHYYVVVLTIVESCSSGPKEVQSETTSKYRGLEPNPGFGSGGYEKPEPELPQVPIVPPLPVVKGKRTKFRFC